MRKNIGLTLGLLWLAIGCATQQYAAISVDGSRALALTDTVRMTSVKSELPILAPGRLFTAGKHLVLYEYAGEKRFQVYDLPLTGKCFEAGMIGRGPHEFIDPDMGSMLGCDDGFYLADQDAFKTVRIGDRSLSVVSKVPLLTEGANLNGVIKVKDKYLNPDVYAMVPGSLPEGPRQFQVIGPKGVEKRIAELPEWNDDDDNLVRYFSSVVARPGEDVFAAFYALNFRKIRYYNLDGDLLMEVSADFPDKSIHGSDECFSTYGRAFASKDRIVVICNNSSRMAKDKTPSCTELQIWDWKGHLIHRLIVTMRFGVYTVDFSTGLLYVASGGHEDEIFYCDISKYL